MANQKMTETVERSPFNAIPFVYYRDTRAVFRAIRDLHKEGVFVDMEDLRAATALDGRQAMPSATFREYTFAMRAFGWLEERRSSAGKNEGAPTPLGTHIIRYPGTDPNTVIAQWKPILDRFALPLIERDFHLLSANDLEARLALLPGVTIPRRRARFWKDFYPLYKAIETGNVDEYMLYQNDPEKGPRRVNRPRPVTVTVEDAPPEADGAPISPTAPSAPPPAAQAHRLAVITCIACHGTGKILVQPDGA